MPGPDDIDRLLADLLVALRAGQLDRINTLTDALDRSLAACADHPPAVSRQPRLRRLATEAAILSQAAAEGVAAARRRMAEIAAVRRGLSTYGRDGLRRTDQQTGRLGRRA